MPKKNKEKKILAPSASRYMSSLSVEEDELIRKAAKALSLPRGVFIRTAAIKWAAECGYFLKSAEKPDNYPVAPPVKSAWVDVME